MKLLLHTLKASVVLGLVSLGLQVIQAQEPLNISSKGGVLNSNLVIFNDTSYTLDISVLPTGSGGGFTRSLVPQESLPLGPTLNISSVSYGVHGKVWGSLFSKTTKINMQKYYDDARRNNQDIIMKISEQKGLFGRVASFTDIIEAPLERHKKESQLPENDNPYSVFPGVVARVSDVNRLEFDPEKGGLDPSIEPRWVLGVPENASQTDITQAYALLVKKWNVKQFPKNQQPLAQQIIQIITAAYHRLQR